MGRGLSSQTLHARQRRICAPLFVDQACTRESRHPEPSLEVRVDILRPAELTATRPVMRNVCSSRGFPGPNRTDRPSRFFLLQDSFCFLPAIAQVLLPVEYRILCVHDFPSLGCDWRLVSRRDERSPYELFPTGIIAGSDRGSTRLFRSDISIPARHAVLDRGSQSGFARKSGPDPH